ncbi:bZIP transcription factor [Aspergillus novofumigatus IBT 16806]|uniref:Putative bZIP transcription factor n=1 Tax=Aspergillus novofumigatus (strain IBT 16806) TaxID=1392255 RepID=A0A2I1CDB0_ASPN1|nr:putative bZIP transcription factor [Aspergillus novofumigatus IBT 16806]PKX95620.1 putative bZIP transcription factor [Aspergillus novofumigatus IBT 16806]
MSDEQRQQSLARQVAASNYERLENFNFLLSRHDPAVAKSRQYSFDADSAALASLQNLNMEYDQTEGMGGISVSSYDSIEDERSPIDLRGYPYRGDKSINYSLPDQMLSYPAHPIYPPIYSGDELGHPPGAMTPSDVSSSISPPNGQLGNIKYSTPVAGESIASALGQEEELRRAAEEDRRRRNTAASARFRMKKKQREQTLERTVRETTEKNASLEARVAQLEMENRCTALSSKTNGLSGSGQKHIQPKKKGVGTDN